MINLLDADAKRELKAARLNVVLLTYCAIVGATVASIIVLAGFSYWWLNNQISVAESQKATYEAGTSAYQDVIAQSNQFSANLGKIQSVLTNRSHYYTALLNIAASLPSGAYISDLSLSPTFATTPLKISATAPNRQAGLTLKEKLSSSKVYSKVTIDNISCDDESGPGCRVALTATLDPKNIFTSGGTE